MGWSMALLLLPLFAWADVVVDEAPLDAPYGKSHPVVDSARLFPFALRFLDDRNQNDLETAISRQTPVKSQGGRGTCSIFSATGALESLLKIRADKDLDLAENYLEYLVMSKVKPNNPSEGSDTPWNFYALSNYGTILEEAWPYETFDWTKDDLPQSERERRDQVCVGLQGDHKMICHLAHRGPDEDPDADSAAEFHREHELSQLFYKVLVSKRAIERVLDAGYPLVLSVEFFYGAWNHRLMEEYGIGKRNLEQWSRGEVGGPNANDIELSRKHPAGHSIVVVGYDNKRRIYFFKNSWGTSSFGTDVDLLGGKIPTEGYGTIDYDYAHRFGTFYRVGP